MKPVPQTILAPPTGNCHAACIASILELPIDRVPSMYEGADDPLLYDRDKAWRRQRSWLKAMGLGLFHIERKDDSPEDWPGWTPSGFWIASHEVVLGRAGHSTVWKGGRCVWDPWPDADPEVERGTLVVVEWFEALDPALLACNLPGRWKRAERPRVVRVG